MNYWRKINNWEKNIEAAPKRKLLRLLVLIFSFSAVFGGFISYTVTSFQIKAVEKHEKTIRQAEIESMNLLINSVQKKFRY